MSLGQTKHYFLELIDKYNSPDIFDDDILLPSYKVVGQNSRGDNIYVDLTREQREQLRLERIKFWEARWKEFQSSLEDLGKKWYAICGHYGKPDVMVEEVDFKCCKFYDNPLMPSYILYDRETGLCKERDIMFYHKECIFDTKDEALEYAHTVVKNELTRLQADVAEKQKRIHYLENVLSA